MVKFCFPAGEKQHFYQRPSEILKGSARGVGAFAIADCATEIERQPEDGQALKRLGKLIDEVRDFIAAINR